MKKYKKVLFVGSVFLIVGAALALPVKAVVGDWSSSGSTIFYNDGNVGIGTSSSSFSKLTIAGNDTAVDFNALRLGTINDRFWEIKTTKYGHPNYGDYALMIKQATYADCAGCFGDLVLLPKRSTYFATGNVGIGKQNPTEKLEVNGKIKAREIIVTTSGWADYVFSDDYNLMNLADLEVFINENGHLPNIPSASSLETSGLSVGEMQKLQMEKIEELTLHLIEKEKEVEDLSERIERLEAKLVE